MGSEYCLLKEKVQRLEDALKSLGDEMQEKINLILEYLLSSREDKFVAQKKICDKNISMLNELMVKCERGTAPSSHSVGGTSKIIRRVCLSHPPPPVFRSQIFDETQIIPQTHDATLTAYKNSQFTSNQFNVVRSNSEHPIVSTIAPAAINSFPSTVHGNETVEIDVTQLTDTDSTTDSQNQFDQEFSSAGVGQDSVMTNKHFQEFVPVQGNACELQYENIDICSIKIEPEFIEDAATDMKTGDTTDCSDFLNRILNPEESESYGITEGNHLENIPISETSNNEASIGLQRRLRGSSARFQCALCPKYYKAANNLRIHLRTHTGERPFKCPECQVSFADPSNLRKHIKKGYHVTKNRPMLKQHGVTGLRSLLGGGPPDYDQGDADDRSSSEI